MQMLNQKQKIVVFAYIIIIAIVIIVYYISSTKDVYEFTENAENNEIIEDDNGNFNNRLQETKAKNKIIIHIAGAVKNAGIVEVEENARINNVIEAAGGVLDDADLDKVNLAYAVEDGQKIYIPFKAKESQNIEIITRRCG